MKTQSSSKIIQHKNSLNQIAPYQKSEQQGVHELKQNYKINEHKHQKVLGSGAYGKVFQSYNIHNPDLKVAIKVMDKEKMQFNMQCIIDEVAILIKLDHPNIVKYYETYNDNKFVYLVQEYIDGK